MSQDEPTGGGLEGLAIIGMSARLPGAANLEAYWQNLRDGVESIRFFSAAELRAAGVGAAELEDPNYVKARGALDDTELFDAGFFGFTPREAETMDPQHRLFLEEAWTALEHAGLDPDHYPGAIGLFAGSNLTGYLVRNLAPNEALVRRVGPLQIRIRNDKDFLATLAAYKLNLKGPALNVQTACSSSLVGVALACQSLLSYQTDVALAGGVSVTVPSRSGYLYQEGVYAPDGHCRAFDAKARGTVLGDGVAIVVLKRLSDALADGDTVHAVIRGFATNNDGALKLDYTAPSVDGQAEVIGMAQILGEISPDSLSYIEAHGTGTPLGDPIEVSALTQAFRAGTNRVGFCGLGSVKTNIGHLDAAAGVAGLIKTVLALEHCELPATLHFEAPNPQLDLASTPFYVVAARQPWLPAAGQPRRAGVSSFGVGGTNAHVIVEEAPAPEPTGASRPWQVLVLSAATETALEVAAANLAAQLESQPETPLADVAFTLATGRKALPHRRAVVASSTAEAIAALRGEAPRRLTAGQVGKGARRSLAFLLPGIGDQYPGMAKSLYEREPVFRETLDACAEILSRRSRIDILELLVRVERGATGAELDLRRMLGRATAEADPAAERLDRTELLHPTLFSLEVALARQWMAWGFVPRALLGYSIGEYVAAHLAGVFDLESALRLVAERARIIEKLPGGGMLAITLSEAEVLQLLTEPAWSELGLAAVNGAAFSVVAGAEGTLSALAGELARRGVTTRRLKARHAFHSPSLRVALPEFSALMRGVELSPPTIPFISNLTGTWITDDQATDPAYWAEHLCRTVRFSDGLEAVTARGSWAFLELGAGQSLGSIVAASGAEAFTVPALPHQEDPQDAQALLLHGLGRLWSGGVEPDWKSFFAAQTRRRIPLPTYPFERQRYWVDPVATSAPAVDPMAKKKDPKDWFYLPSWRQLPSGAAAPPAEGTWWIVSHGSPVGPRLETALVAAGRSAVLRTSVATFAEPLPRHLVWIAEPTESAFLDLADLLQAWAGAPGTAGRELSLTVVTRGGFEVVGTEAVVPEAALLSGLCRVIPQEFPHLRCRQIDLAPDGETATELLLAELGLASPPLVALRGRRRFERSFEAVELGAFEAKASRLREGGRYLLTGGLGGLGLAFARFLAESCRARLVLLGRSADATSESTRQVVAELEGLGAQVLICRGDVTVCADLERVRSEVLARFGALDGVIHAAGTPPGGLLAVKSREAMAAVLAPKLDGTRHLDQVFGGEGLDFLLLCSSLTALAGATGLGDHAAANAYLDAYAQRARAAGRSEVLAVNWDTWLEVGQAAAAGITARMGDLLGEGSEIARFPSWRRSRAESGAESFLTGLDTDHWFVGEHRLNGHGLLPGTSYFELLLSAVGAAPGAESIAITDVFFEQPCLIADGARLALRVTLWGDGAAVLESAAGPAGPWTKHVKARLTRGASPTPTQLDLGRLAGLGVERSLDPAGDAQAAAVTFGRRWRESLRELRTAEREGWARLVLPAEFQPDLEVFNLHPALLDLATGIARVLGQGTYLPAGYERLTVFAPLAGELVSHFRRRDDGAAETLVIDVAIADASGTLLAEAEGFVLRPMPPAALASLSSPVAPPKARAETELGLTPGEGAEALGRLLAAPLGAPQILVSVRDWHAVDRYLAGLEGEKAAAHLADLGRRGERARSASHAPYVAPRSALEATLASLFEDMLGAGHVGIHDNFFDLGGNSLVATQLISRLRQSFRVEVALRSLFEAPTVAELALSIVRLQAASIDERELEAALAELAGLSPEEIERQLLEENEQVFSERSS